MKRRDGNWGEDEDEEGEDQEEDEGEEGEDQEEDEGEEGEDQEEDEGEEGEDQAEDEGEDERKGRASGRRTKLKTQHTNTATPNRYGRLEEENFYEIRSIL